MTIYYVSVMFMVTKFDEGDEMNNEIISRQQAISEGKIRYFTGKPCRRGHIAERFCVSSSCVKCIPEYQKRTKSRINDALMHSSLGFIDVQLKVHPIHVPLIKRFNDIIHAYFKEPSRKGDVATIIEILNYLEYDKK